MSTLAAIKLMTTLIQKETGRKINPILQAGSITTYGSPHRLQKLGKKSNNWTTGIIECH